MKHLAVLAVLAAALIAPSVAQADRPVVYVGTTSTTVSKAQLDTVVAAYQVLVSRDLQKWWGVDAVITDDPAAESTAQMVLWFTDEDSGSIGALGEHGVQDGRPTAWVYAEICAAVGDDAFLVGSHELEEMLVDPWITRFQSGIKGRMYLVEVADPVEDGSYAYWINGIPISDFITPFWYGAAKGQRVDHLGHLKRPGQVGRGGYVSFKNVDGDWIQIFA